MPGRTAPSTAVTTWVVSGSGLPLSTAANFRIVAYVGRGAAVRWPPHISRDKVAPATSRPDLQQKGQGH